MKYNFCALLDKKQRVDMYLSALFKDFSRSYIQKMIDSWQLKVNSRILNKNKKIQNKDELELTIKTQKLKDIKPEKINLDIIYEDENLLIINKDAWINVHPTPWENWKTWTMVNAILNHCWNNLPVINWVERPWIVHRLDKDTSGAILIAKTDKMMSYLANIIKNRKIEKYYLAIVYWKFSQKKFKIESYIWRDPNDRTKMTTKSPINPKIAVTYWELIDYIDDKYSLLKIRLETGRTHQIRVHLASIWYPIIWDKVYWSSKINNEVFKKFWLTRQALHAFELKFKLYDKYVKFKADLKGDMKKIIWDIII